MTPLSRKTPLARGGRIKPRNATRRNKEWVRAYGSAERVAFVQQLPCVACSRVPCEVAHVTTGGMGRKADAQFTVPLCALCHRISHQQGQQSFAAAWGLDLSDVAARVQAAWEARCAA